MLLSNTLKQIAGALSSALLSWDRSTQAPLGDSGHGSLARPVELAR